MNQTRRQYILNNLIVKRVHFINNVNFPAKNVFAPFGHFPCYSVFTPIRCYAQDLKVVLKGEAPVHASSTAPHDHHGNNRTI